MITKIPEISNSQEDSDLKLVRNIKIKDEYELNFFLSTKKFLIQCTDPSIPYLVNENSFSLNELHIFNKFFESFNDIKEVSSFFEKFDEKLIKFERNNENIDLTFICIFEEKMIDICFSLKQFKKINANEMIVDLYTKVKDLKKENDNLKEEVKSIKTENENLKSKLENMQNYNTGVEEIISFAENGIIKSLNKKIKSFNLLYNAKRDGDSVKTFHQNCNGHENTLTIIKTVKGKIFGGFTRLAWLSEKKELEDDKGFLFSFNKKEFYYRNKDVKTEIRTNPDNGPSFGRDKNKRYIDLVIKDNCLSNDNCRESSNMDAYITNGQTYVLNGECQFKVLNYEVYELTLEQIK